MHHPTHIQHTEKTAELHPGRFSNSKERRRRSGEKKPLVRRVSRESKLQASVGIGRRRRRHVWGYIREQPPPRKSHSQQQMATEATFANTHTLTGAYRASSVPLSFRSNDEVTQRRPSVRVSPLSWTGSTCLCSVLLHLPRARAAAAVATSKDSRCLYTDGKTRGRGPE